MARIASMNQYHKAYLWSGLKLAVGLAIAIYGLSHGVDAGLLSKLVEAVTGGL